MESGVFGFSIRFEIISLFYFLTQIGLNVTHIVNAKNFLTKFACLNEV